MRTRKEKIEFLNGLMTGERKLNELRPAKCYSFDQDANNPDIFKESGTGKVFTQAQLDELEKENPNSMFVIYVSPHSPSRPGAQRIDFNLAS